MNQDETKLDNIKKVINEIIIEIKKEENISEKIKIYPIYINEYFKIDQVKERWKQVSIKEKFKMLKEPSGIFGVNFPDTNEIYIIITTLIKDSKKKKVNYNSPHLLSNIITAIYHEIGHSYQRIKKENYEFFEKLCIAFIEKYIKGNNPQHYQNNYDDYLFETDADIFAINKTEQYLKKKHLYNSEKEYIDFKKEIAYFRKNNFDFNKIWQEFIKVYDLELKKGNTIEEPVFKNLIDIFFQKNTTNFKNITEIYQNPQFKVLDKKMFCSILTSTPFLNQLSIENLTEKEKNIMIEIVEYCLTEEQNKQQYNEDVFKNKIINKNLVLKAIQEKEKKIKLLKYLLEELKLRENEIIIESNKSRK